MKENTNGIMFKIKVQPRASKNEIKGIHGDSLKIRLTSPPVDGEANNACQSYFADLLKVSKSSIKIVSGLTSRNKTLLIEGLTKEEFFKIINKYL